MDKLIKHWEGKSFSGEDVHRLCEGKVSVKRYKELARARSLDEAWGKHKALIVLYETKDGYGHWCAIFEVDRDTMEFFDPYGMAPDAELNFINQRFRESSGQLPYLTDLMLRSRHKNVVY